MTRSDEPPKLNVTVLPAWELSNSVPSSVKVPFNEAAAYTVNVWPLDSDRAGGLGGATTPRGEQHDDGGGSKRP